MNFVATLYICFDYPYFYLNNIYCSNPRFICVVYSFVCLNRKVSVEFHFMQKWFQLKCLFIYLLIHGCVNITDTCDNYIQPPVLQRYSTCTVDDIWRYAFFKYLFISSANLFCVVVVGSVLFLFVCSFYIFIFVFFFFEISNTRALLLQSFCRANRQERVCRAVSIMNRRGSQKVGS